MKKDGAYIAFLIGAATAFVADVIFAVCLTAGLTRMFGGNVPAIEGLVFWSAVVLVVNIACVVLTIFYFKKRKE